MGSDRINRSSEDRGPARGGGKSETEEFSQNMLEVLCLSSLSLIISFAPWMVLKFVSNLPFADPLTMLKIALSLAAMISLYQSLRSSVRGFIFWGTIAFFAFSLVSVVALTNMWVISHLGLLAQLNLNVIAWGSLLCRRPFTIDYAKLHVPQELWTHPRFLRKNYLITGIWGVYFLLGLALAEIRIYEPQVSHILLEVLDNGLMLGAVLLTSHFSKKGKGAYTPSESGESVPASAD